jgi:uncharacterized membrane protein YeaQ/YmgE (transglycosylase-associated protein family)
MFIASRRQSTPRAIGTQGGLPPFNRHSGLALFFDQITSLARRRKIMGLIMWLIVGGVIGWLASLIMRTDGSQGIVLNIVVGVLGAFIGGMILSRGDINNAPLTVTTFLVSLAGALILLAVVNLVRRGSIR